MLIRPMGLPSFADLQTAVVPVSNRVTTVEDRTGITADCWDDMRISLSELRAGLGAPPVWKSLTDDGGAPGTALEFIAANNHYVQVTDNALYDVLPVSVSLWVRLTALPVGTATMRLLDKAGNYTISVNSSGRISWSVYGSPNNSPNGALAVGAWTHIVCTHDAAVARIYVNGVLVADRVSAETVTAPSSNMFFGGSGSSYSMDGTLDEIVIFNIALTQAQVNALYNDGIGYNAVASADIIGLFKFDEAAGLVAVDSSASANNGTLSGITGTPAYVAGKVSSASKGIYVPHFEAGTTEEVWFETQFSHRYKQGTDLEPHIHVIPRGDPADTGEIRFKLEYVWLNASGDPVVNTVTSTGSIVRDAGDAESTCMVVFPAIEGSGMRVSSCFLARLYRDSTDTWPGDVALQSMDFHYLVDSNGSDGEAQKSY